MSNNEELLESYKKERINLSSMIDEEKKDLYKYQNRRDYASVKACKERQGNLKSQLRDVEKEIVRLERIIENDGVDPYSPIPYGVDSPSTSISIDDGSIEQTVDLTIDIEGTKGKGKHKKTVNINQGQRIERNTQIKQGNIVDQTTNVNDIKSTKKIKNTDLISSNEKKISNFSDDLPESDKKPRKYIRKAERSGNIAADNSFKNKSRIKNDKTLNQISNGISKKKKNKSESNNKIIENKKSYKSNPKSSKWIKINNKYVRESDIQKIEFYTSDSNELKPEDIKRMRIEREKMDNFLSFIKKGNSRFEACRYFNVSPDIIEDWYNKGAYGFDENTIYFFNNLYELERNYKSSQKEKMDAIISFMKKGNTRTQASEYLNISLEVIEKWYDEGLNSFDENTIYFYNQIHKIEHGRFEKEKMNIVLENLRKGATYDIACKNANVEFGMFDKWRILGKEKKSENAIYFYNELKEIEKIKLERKKLIADETKQEQEVNENLEVSNKNKNDALDNDEIHVKINYSKRNFCQYCGKKIEINDKFCMNCGKKLVDDIYNDEGVFDKIQRRIKRFF